MAAHSWKHCNDGNILGFDRLVFVFPDIRNGEYIDLVPQGNDCALLEQQIAKKFIRKLLGELFCLSFRRPSHFFAFFRVMSRYWQRKTEAKLYRTGGLGLARIRQSQKCPAL